MADFRTALEALANEKISIDALGMQLEKLLQENPSYAIRMLEQLDEVHDQKKIDDKDYATLKRQINQYRRTHAAETEGEEAGADSTVFAQEDNFADQAQELARQMAEQETQQPQTVDDEEITEIKGSAEATELDDEDSTEINEATQSEKTMQPEDVVTDSTKVMSETEHQDAAERSGGGEGGDTSGIDFDLHSLDTGTAPASATGPTGTEWQEPAAGGYTPGKDYGPGDIIKQRFKLLKVLGIGGMGKVYMATDLLKEEARDKKPNVAIKLLNDDFKDHPEAFISLQRESSRQQKLAHPNIATIYDFDRVGGPGTPVFITMELMEGMELKDYIKKVVRKQGGIPFEEAFKIVKQLGDGLIYAHERQLVHSDFKPGNAFLCNDGTVKTLDFGIARAVKNPVTGEAEKTLFDPGKLGALTPAYASLEMLEGEEPDTRDDIYALGCVAYELLTGKHPFNKLPATTARENGLVAPIVKGVNKKTNRALRRAVAFKREDRSPTVQHFIEEFEGRPTWHKHPATWAAGILLIIGAIMTGPALNKLNQMEIEGIIADMNTGSKQVIVEKLAEIKERPETEQDQIINGARDAIQNYYRSQIDVLIDISGDGYDFPQAQNIINEVGGLYPETVFLNEIQDEFDENKRLKIADLNKAYIDALNDTSQIASTQQILATIRNKIDPSHPLLSDPRPANAYRLAAQDAFDNNDYQQALAYIDSGLQTAADDARLTDLRSNVERAIEVDELNQSLGTVQEQLASLSDFQSYQQDIIRLSEISTREQAPVLDTLSTRLKGIITSEIQRVDSEGTRADAEALVNQYEDLLSSLLLADELTQLKLSHLSGDERTQRIAEIVSTERATIDAQLAAPNLEDPQWESTLLASMRQLNSLASVDDSVVSDLINYRETITQLYIDSAEQTLQQDRFDAADALVDRGLKFNEDSTVLADTRTRIADARTEYERDQQIRGLKDNLVVQTDGNDVTAAQQTLDQLKTLLDPNDTYLTVTAPRMMAASYARLAEDNGTNGEYERAMQYVNAGLEISPRDPTLQTLRAEYIVEVNIAELSDLFQIASAANFNPEDVQQKVDEIQNNPEKFDEFRQQAESVLADRIRFLANTSEEEAAGLAESASMIFPTSTELADLRAQYQLKPWPNFNQARNLVADGKLTEANTLLQADSAEYSGHPDFIRFQQTLESGIKKANEIYDQYVQEKDAAGNSYNDLRQARKLLTRLQAQWIDNPDYDNAEDDIVALINAAPDNPANRVLARESTDLAAAAATPQVQQEWKPIASARPCTTDLATHGQRARAVCFDMVNTTWRGPYMVVVPPKSDDQTPFAIGKYEISVGDYSKYCYLTGNCKPITVKERLNDAMTGISLEDAERYAEWLSERTGKHYRIPTRSEWEYAASAEGEQPAKNANCRLELSGKVIKGTGIASVRDGPSNGWGLKGYIGNAQELVLDDESGSPIAAGGAYSDQHSKCDISLQRPYSGDGDDVTGFRVVLDDVG